MTFASSEAVPMVVLPRTSIYANLDQGLAGLHTGKPFQAALKNLIE
jgi:hypothetical protein